MNAPFVKMETVVNKIFFITTLMVRVITEYL